MHQTKQNYSVTQRGKKVCPPRRSVHEGQTMRERQAHLQLPCHGHHIVVGGVVLVAVGEHESNVAGKLLSVPVFPAVDLPLRQREGKDKFSAPMLSQSGLYLMR